MKGRSAARVQRVRRVQRVVDCPAGNDYEVSVTGLAFVSSALHEVVLQPPSSGRQNP